MRILLTAGATREPIDAVRYLSNISTGATGAELAVRLQALGHRLTLLHGENAVQPTAIRDREAFTSARDLQRRLKARLSRQRYDVVVMAAAVADYRPSRSVDGKLSSATGRRTLTLVRNDKILPRLKAYANQPPLVVGFKLTAGASEIARRRAVRAQFAAGGVDIVVHNDLGEIAVRARHPFRIWTSPQLSLPTVRGTARLARSLDRILSAASAPIVRRRPR